MSVYTQYSLSGSELGKILERVDIHVSDALRAKYEGSPKEGPFHPSVRRVLDRPRIESNSEEWGARRKLMLTASDVGAVLGHNKYTAQDRVLLKKTGRGKQFCGNIATRHGQKYEDLAARLYEYVMKIPIIHEDIGLMVSESHPWLGATPDRIAKYIPLIMEIKCPFRRKPDGTIPEHYRDQMYLQMHTTGIKTAHFIEYVPPDRFKRGSLWVSEIQWDETWWVESFPILKSFWGRVERFYESELGMSLPEAIRHQEAKSKDLLAAESGTRPVKKMRSVEPVPCEILTPAMQRTNELLGFQVVMKPKPFSMLGTAYVPPKREIVNVFNTPTEQSEKAQEAEREKELEALAREERRKKSLAWKSVLRN
jgi:putative phage-type endonuclease